MNGKPSKPVIYSVHYGNQEADDGAKVEEGKVDFSNWKPMADDGGHDFGFLNPDGSITGGDHGYRSDADPGSAVNYPSKKEWDDKQKDKGCRVAWCVTCNDASIEWGSHGFNNSMHRD